MNDDQRCMANGPGTASGIGPAGEEGNTARDCPPAPGKRDIDPRGVRDFCFGRLRFLMLVLISVALPARFAIAAQNPSSSATATANATERDAAGDQPDDPGPLASGLSFDIARPAVLQAMKRVADWQLKQAQGHYNIQWTYAALYDGFLAASRSTGDNRYHDEVLAVAEQNHWQLGPRFGHADDEAIGLAYLTLYAENHNRERVNPTREGMDRVVARPDDPEAPLWWWCDALYMAPPVLAQLSVTTGDQRYLDFMDHEWSITSAALYDPSEHLFFRDKRFLTMKDANGQKVFWSRGNGWVLASLAMILERMPEKDQRRAKYIQQYRDMAARVAGLQTPDGLWCASLLDPGAYRSPEISGSAFFTYAMAWGIHHHLLDRKKYLPVVTRAWSGMLTHVYENGRLGSIQPIGGAPDKFKPSSSYVYGVGAFLLAGSELAQIIR